MTWTLNCNCVIPTAEQTKRRIIQIGLTRYKAIEFIIHSFVYVSQYTDRDFYKLWTSDFSNVKKKSTKYMSKKDYNAWTFIQHRKL